MSTGIRGYKCNICQGTLIGTITKDPRLDYIGKSNRILKICRGCLEKIDQVRLK